MPSKSFAPKNQDVDDYTHQIMVLFDLGVIERDKVRERLPKVGKAMFDHAYENAYSRLRNARIRRAKDAMDLYLESGGNEGMDLAAAHQTFFPDWTLDSFKNLLNPKNKQGKAEVTYENRPKYLSQFQGQYKKQANSLKTRTRKLLMDIITDYSHDAGVSIVEAEKAFQFVGKQLGSLMTLYKKKLREFESRKDGLDPADEPPEEA